MLPLNSITDETFCATALCPDADTVDTGDPGIALGNRRGGIRARDHEGSRVSSGNEKREFGGERSHGACDSESPFSCNGSVNVVSRTRHCDEMGSLVSDTQSALPRHRARCNRKPGNGTRAVFVAISGTPASRERFQRVPTSLTRTHLYSRNGEPGFLLGPGALPVTGVPGPCHLWSRHVDRFFVFSLFIVQGNGFILNMCSRNI